MKRYSNTQMRQYYEEWQASGQSKSSFCTEKGIVNATFHYWIKKFQNPKSLSKNGKGGFSTVVLEQNTMLNSNQPVLRINYGSGVSIDFFGEVDARYIKSLCQ